MRSDGNEQDGQFAHKDPWRKSSVLTLDGGGIRGYTSLWMLKILMETVETIKKEDQEPPESSFRLGL
ncbi:hypothetical protein DL98DRAFT_599226 [Cadophora sp. DSE1049]|nr:hypothetical protein DL98DRAFT_599226 [Cadophora sp. DSE1049]